MSQNPSGPPSSTPTPNTGGANAAGVGGSPPENRFSDDERKYFDYIQAVIARLAGNQFLFKGWVLTVAVALFSYAAAHHEASVAFLSIIVIAGFAGLDMYFLKQERLFRFVWADAITRNSPLYDMSLTSHVAKLRYFRRNKTLGQRKRDVLVLSRPIAGLYGILIISAVAVGLAISVSSARQDRANRVPSPQPTQSASAAHPSR